MKIEGFDKFQKQLKDLERNMKKIGGEHIVPLNELFNTRFMRTYTQYSSFEEMLNASGNEIESQSDLDSLSENLEWDLFVSQNSRFRSWEAMKIAAGKEHGQKMLNDAVKRAFR
ncbi:hypothetical protein [Leptospira sarikeiensis]|uniref:hypothetical protein n=1 Tax=Leptospira sarikeiensis TaxID=2484943 RepID=UPI001AEF3EA1|nr:hypothetical protein [Leptospira sarikeiensis]